MNRKYRGTFFTFFLICTTVFCVHNALGQVLSGRAFEVEQMIREYDRNSTVSEKKITSAESRFRDHLDKGLIKPHRDPWMLDEDYCKNLGTVSLAKKCFSDGIFEIEMGLFASYREIAFMRLRVSHKGFAEFFKRPDMWKGVLFLYEMVSSGLDPDNELDNIMSAAGVARSLENFYFFQPFKNQIKGREKIFLEANIRVLKQFKRFIEQADWDRLGTKLPFYGSPSVVADVALMLDAKTDPRHYAEIITEISAFRFGKEQKLEEVKQYLDVVIPALEKKNLYSFDKPLTLMSDDTYWPPVLIPTGCGNVEVAAKQLKADEDYPQDDAWQNNQWKKMKAAFPDLVDSDRLGNATRTYNCHSYIFNNGQYWIDNQTPYFGIGNGCWKPDPNGTVRSRTGGKYISGSHSCTIG